MHSVCLQSGETMKQDVRVLIGGGDDNQHTQGVLSLLLNVLYIFL